MATELKLRRGTTSQHSSFTGAEAEVTVDTDKETVVVHDGTTVGGYALAREDMSNVPNDTISGDQIAGGDATFDSINVDSGTLFVDSTNNRVGVGTSSPNSALAVDTSEAGIVNLESSNSSGGYLRFRRSGTTKGYIGSSASFLGGGTEDDFGVRAESNFTIATSGASEAARIDSSGNLLVGMTSASTTSIGCFAGPSGFLYAGRNNNTVAVLDRKSSDGDILYFRKDGSTVGSIGTVNSRMVLGTGNTQLNFFDATDSIRPAGSNLINRDAAIDLGGGAARFKDLYLSGGVYLGGTGSANYLDDYEEGTFTPFYHAQNNSFDTITYVEQEGFYTKIGNVVYVSLGIIVNSLSKGSANGIVSIRGFPFSFVSNALQSFPAVSVDLQQQWNDSPTGGFFSPSQGELRLTQITKGDPGYDFIRVSEMMENNQNRVRISGFYYTDS